MLKGNFLSLSQVENSCRFHPSGNLLAFKSDSGCSLHDVRNLSHVARWFAFEEEKDCYFSNSGGRNQLKCLL